MRFTARQLAEALADEFERDSWGMIDPELFRAVADGQDVGDSDVRGLEEVLVRVTTRLNEGVRG